MEEKKICGDQRKESLEERYVEEPMGMNTKQISHWYPPKSIRYREESQQPHVWNDPSCDS